jgi:predicted nucleic acid-binding protein
LILLDTNIISEVMRPAPDPRVICWLNGADAGILHVSTISIAEILYGLDLLPAGRRRVGMEEQVEAFLLKGFSQRIMSFDKGAARHYGPLMADRRRAGRPMAAPDGQIAAIARSRAMALATRNIRDFEACGLALINPWA